MGQSKVSQVNCIISIPDPQKGVSLDLLSSHFEGGSQSGRPQYSAPYAIMTSLFSSSRPDPPQRAGDCRAEAEDSRGDGRDAKPVLLVGRQQPQPRHPTLLLQVYGQ